MLLKTIDIVVIKYKSITKMLYRSSTRKKVEAVSISPSLLSSDFELLVKISILFSNLINLMRLLTLNKLSNIMVEIWRYKVPSNVYFNSLLGLRFTYFIWITYCTISFSISIINPCMFSLLLVYRSLVACCILFYQGVGSSFLAVVLMPVDCCDWKVASNSAGVFWQGPMVVTVGPYAVPPTAPYQLISGTFPTVNTCRHVLNGELWFYVCFKILNNIASTYSKFPISAGGSSALCLIRSLQNWIMYKHTNIRKILEYLV